MDDRATHQAPEGTAAQPAALGEYQLSPHFARRSVADVYDATHAPTGGARRVYVLRPGAMQNNPLVHRVVCEADAARWLRHAAAAKLEAHGDTPSRRLYVAVERPTGRPLDAVVAEAGRLAPRRVVRVAGRLVEALDEAHAVGLVHGRLTPAAVIVDVLDAEGSGAGGAPSVTLTGLGTAALDALDPVAPGEQPYISPEQLAGGEPDVRSDVYGLASLLQHALTGESPARVDAEEAPHAADAGAVSAVLAVARAADPRRRQATVKAFWEDLLEALVADAMRATTTSDDVSAAAPPARPTVPLDENAALAHLELADVSHAAPAAPTPATSPPGAAPGRRAPAASPPPALEFGGVDVTVARPVDAARRQLQPRWNDARSAPATHPAAHGPARTRRPARGARTLLVHAWWLAVPAVAAAFGWPISRSAATAADADRPAATTSDAWRRVTAPPVLATVTARRRSAVRVARGIAAGTLVQRDVDAAGVADDPQLADSGATSVELPAIEVADREPRSAAPATARVLVHPEEFSTRIKIPGAP